MHLGSTSGIFPSGFLSKNLYVFHMSPVRARCLILFILFVKSPWTFPFTNMYFLSTVTTVALYHAKSASPVLL